MINCRRFWEDFKKCIYVIYLVIRIDFCVVLKIREYNDKVIYEDKK